MIKKYKTNQTLVSTGFNQPSGHTLTLSGNTLLANGSTFRYASDRSSTYVARSLVDAGYVTGLTSNIGNNQEVIFKNVNKISGATGFLYNISTSGVTVPNLCISTTPASDGGANWLLSWDSGTSQVRKVNYNSSIGLSSAVNGLSSSSGSVCLGGTLCTDTIICGNDNFSLSLKSLCSACIITTANNIVLDSRGGTGGIYLKSQNGVIASPVTNYSSTIGIGIDYVSNLFKIYDNRSGANQKGIEYDNDYSTFYSPRSLVDRQYVDNLSNGYTPKQAVQATTSVSDGNILLSGDTGTIDGVSVSNIILSGNRILVKNQTNGALNGVYSASTGNWGRTSDFDFNPSGEVVQGSYFYVISGTSANTQTWVLTTPNIITSGETLTFTLFSRITNIEAGTGIDINVTSGGTYIINVDGASLAGTNMIWSGNTFNVVGGDYVSTNVFTGYTANTETRINDIEAYYVSGATNGLNINNKNVKLGGALTENTNITGNYTLTLSGGSKLNTTCGYQISGVTMFSAPRSLSNIAIGCESLRNISTGINNIGIGYQALCCIQNGRNNIGIGNQSLLNNCGGCFNIAIGCSVLTNNSGGRCNIGIGGDSLYQNSTGCGNIGYGNSAIFANINGCFNIGIGAESLYTNCTGSHNIALGCQTLYRNISGNDNIGIGCRALYCNSTASNLIAIGCYALYNNKCVNISCNGQFNIALGYNSLYSNTYGCSNIAMGYQTLVNNTTGCNNIAVGNCTLLGKASTPHSNNIGIGNQVLYCISGGTGNIGTGYQTLYNNTKGCYNIASGYQALSANTTGCFNTVYGSQALPKNTTARSNTAIGYQAGFSNVTGSGSTYIGTCAGYNETASNRLHIANNGTESLIYGEFDNQVVKLNSCAYIKTVGNGSINDNVLTWDNSSCAVKKLPYSGITAQIRQDLNTFSGNTYQLYENIKDPSGFIDNENINISYDNVDLKITLTNPNGIYYYWEGTLHRLGTGTTWTSVAHDNNNLDQYLRSIDGINFAWATSIWEFSAIQVSIRPAGTDWAIREVHGTMQHNVHEEFHRVIGTYSKSGFGFTSGTYALRPSSPVNADNTFGLEAGIIADEDVMSTIDAWTQDSYTRLYFTSSGVTNFELSQALPYRVGTTYPLYYTWNGTTFTETEAVSGRYFNYYVIRMPVTSDVNSQLYRAIILQPQFVYTSLVSAQAESPLSLFLGNFTMLTPEFVLVERITMRSQSTYNSVVGRSRIEAIAKLSGSRFFQVSTAVGVGATTAGNVSVVPTSPFSAINMQSWVDEAMTEFTLNGTTDRNNVYSMTVVSTDTILTTGSTYLIFVNSPTSGVTITLPLNPINGQAFKLKDVSNAAYVYNIIIDGNGRNIDGSLTAGINTDYGALELVYNAVLDAWFGLSFLS